MADLVTNYEPAACMVGRWMFYGVAEWMLAFGNGD